MAKHTQKTDFSTKFWLKVKQEKDFKSSKVFDFHDDLFQTENTSLPFEVDLLNQRSNWRFNATQQIFLVRILQHFSNECQLFNILREILRRVIKFRNLEDSVDRLNFITSHPNRSRFFFSERFFGMRSRSFLRSFQNNWIQKKFQLKKQKFMFNLSDFQEEMEDSLQPEKHREETLCPQSKNQWYYLSSQSQANLHPENWTKSEIHNGFNSSRKLQETEALKLHERTGVEIKPYGNDLKKVFKFLLILLTSKSTWLILTILS